MLPIIFMAALAVATAGPTKEILMASTRDTTPRNPLLEGLLLNLLENLREIMLTGTDDIPVLDPLKLDDLNLDLNELLGIEGSYVSFRNFEARKLSTYVIDNLSLDTLSTNILTTRYRLQLEGHIPLLEADAEQYILNINAVGVNLFGNGRASIKIFQPRIIVDMELQLSLLAMRLSILSSNVIFRLDSVEPELTGMFGNTMTDVFVNMFLKNLVEEVLQVYEAEISEVVSALVLEIGNEILADISLIGLIPFPLREEVPVKPAALEYAERG